MKEIVATQKGTEYHVLVDDEDYDELNKYKWHISLGYACRAKYLRTKDGKSMKKNVKMHRVITNAPDHLEVDHINGDRLDNRKENLRLCTRSENCFNRGVQRNNKLGIKGVDKYKELYRASIKINRKKKHIGYFKTIEEAQKAYEAKAKELFGDFYRGNAKTA